MASKSYDIEVPAIYVTQLTGLALTVSDTIRGHGHNRVAYQNAIDAAWQQSEAFRQLNTFWAARTTIRVRWYSKQSGYLAQAGYSDPNTGGWTTVPSAWSR